MFRFFFFNDTATTEIYTLSLHDALPISPRRLRQGPRLSRWLELVLLRQPKRECLVRAQRGGTVPQPAQQDRKSTRLNSSHGYISYAVFCLKKKKGRRLEAGVL